MDRVQPHFVKVLLGRGTYLVDLLNIGIQQLLKVRWQMSDNLLQKRTNTTINQCISNGLHTR